MAYYRTEEGKYKKKMHNRNRKVSPPTSKSIQCTEESEKRMTKKLTVKENKESGFDVGMVLYLVMATSLIEGWLVSQEEIVEMLSRTMRQHSMARQRRVDYIVCHLHENPP